MLRMISRDVMQEVAAAAFVAAVICFGTLLFAHTLAGVACGPAAHPAPTAVVRVHPPKAASAPSETSGVGADAVAVLQEVGL